MMVQASSDSRPSSAASPVSPILSVAGVPLSVEQIEEHTKKLSDGRTQTDVLESKFYRDNAGRIRGETNLPIKQGASIVFVQIVDPVAGFMMVLETPAMIAHRLMVPKTNPSFFGVFGASIGGVAMSGENRKIERLGKRVIETIDCEGVRTTLMSGDQRSVIAVDERWVSMELGVTALVEATGPDEHYSAKIRNVIRQNPDRGLFIIPPDFSIRDVGN